MSHRDTCPDSWEARREGERAHDRGYGSFRNPYDGYGENACDEAARAWRSGWYSAEARQEEREREAAQERAARRRADEEYEYELARQAEEARLSADYEAMLQEQYAEEDAASGRGSKSVDAVDPHVANNDEPSTREKGIE